MDHLDLTCGPIDFELIIDFDFDFVLTFDQMSKFSEMTYLA